MIVLLFIQSVGQSKEITLTQSDLQWRLLSRQLSSNSTCLICRGLLWKKTAKCKNWNETKRGWSDSVSHFHNNIQSYYMYTAIVSHITLLPWTCDAVLYLSWSFVLICLYYINPFNASCFKLVLFEDLAPYWSKPSF